MQKALFQPFFVYLRSIHSVRKCTSWLLLLAMRLIYFENDHHFSLDCHIYPHGSRATRVPWFTARFSTPALSSTVHYHNLLAIPAPHKPLAPHRKYTVALVWKDLFCLLIGWKSEPTLRNSCETILREEKSFSISFWLVKVVSKQLIMMLYHKSVLCNDVRLLPQGMTE